MATWLAAISRRPDGSMVLLAPLESKQNPRARRFLERVLSEDNPVSEVAYVELGYPSELLVNNVVLVDTPGVNDLNEQRAEVTYGYVPRADAVVFLLDAGQALKDSEREFLRSRVLEVRARAPKTGQEAFRRAFPRVPGAAADLLRARRSGS